MRLTTLIVNVVLTMTHPSHLYEYDGAPSPLALFYGGNRIFCCVWIWEVQLLSSCLDEQFVLFLGEEEWWGAPPIWKCSWICLPKPIGVLCRPQICFVLICWYIRYCRNLRWGINLPHIFCFLRGCLKLSLWPTTPRVFVHPIESLWCSHTG